MRDSRGRPRLILKDKLELQDETGTVRFAAATNQVTVNDEVGEPRVSLKPTGAVSVSDNSHVERVAISPPRSEGWCTMTDLRRLMDNITNFDADLNGDGTVCFQISAPPYLIWPSFFLTFCG